MWNPFKHANTYRRARILALLTISKEPITAYTMVSILDMWSGTLYPHLSQLENEGKIKSEWKNGIMSGKRMRVYSIK